MRTYFLCSAILFLVAVSPAAAQHGHGEDFLVGVNALTGQLAVEYDPGNFPFLLPVAENPLLAGWALDDPGLIALDGPDPEDPDFVPVDATADVAFELLSVSSPALKVWNPLGPGEAGFEITPGSFLDFAGTGHFHEHVWWHIDAADPAYSPAGGPWEATFRFVDLRTAGGHAASDPITVGFVPEPAAVLLLGLGALLARRR
jgi:hypothetical protein